MRTVFSNNKISSRYYLSEDLKILQKKITGKSVYKNNEFYKRSPKHKKMIYQELLG